MQKDLHQLISELQPLLRWQKLPFSPMSP
jgi:hypothetical protein